MFPYRIVYPRGDRSKLTVAYVRDYEVTDWDLASREMFDDQDEAWVYCRSLAEQNGLDTQDDPQGSFAYLD